jgi:hypothetical protein
MSGRAVAPRRPRWNATPPGITRLAPRAAPRQPCGPPVGRRALHAQAPMRAGNLPPCAAGGGASLACAFGVLARPRPRRHCRRPTLAANYRDLRVAVMRRASRNAPARRYSPGAVVRRAPGRADHRADDARCGRGRRHSAKGWVQLSPGCCKLALDLTADVSPSTPAMFSARSRS